jgi:hypothetical protein
VSADRIFTEYELRVLQLLVAPRFGAALVRAVAREGHVVEYHYTGVGYFLTVGHPGVPHARSVCHEPLLSAKVADAACGFVVFLENGKLTFECYTFGPETVPENIRELSITIVPLPDNPPRRSMSPRWLSDALGGRVSLSRAFWIYGVGVSVAYSVAGLFIDLEHRTAVVGYLVVGTALGVLQTIILWRCAYNSQSRVLGRLLRIAMIAGLVLVGIVLYVLYRNSDLLMSGALGP